MADHITELQKQGYTVVQMKQTVEGTAYQKLDSKIMGRYDNGDRRIAILTNNDNPNVVRMSEIAARANRHLNGVTVIVHAVPSADLDKMNSETPTEESE